MEQTNKSTKLLLGFVIFLLLIIIAGAIVFKKEIITLKKSKQSLSQKFSSVDATVGSPCGVNNLDNGNILNPNGLQCYFYDSQDSNGNEILPRRGVWIKPNIKGGATFQNNSYADFIDKSKIKTYQTPDQSISFSYPQNWKVITSNWQSDGVIGILTDPNDASISLQISKIKNNAVTVEDRINDIKKSSSTVLENTYTVNGSEVITLDTAPSNNLNGEGGMSWFFKKNGYYVEVEAPKTGYAVMDFPIEYLLSTIKIK